MSEKKVKKKPNKNPALKKAGSFIWLLDFGSPDLWGKI
jgi:hypothetical protein